MSSFGNSYAEVYDILYKEKKYSEEIEYFFELLNRLGVSKVKSVLEVGCGTGGHAPHLSRMGLTYSGVDLSPTMVKIAKSKWPNLDFRTGDIRSLERIGSFDACVSLFHSFGYITDLQDVEAALQNIKNNLTVRGLFIFDVWNGLSVIDSPPVPTLRNAKTDDGSSVYRYSSPELNLNSSLVKLLFDVLLLKENELISSFKEQHVMRYYFPSEIQYLLRKNGFRVLGIFPFMKFENDISVADKSMIIISQVIS